MEVDYNVTILGISICELKWNQRQHSTHIAVVARSTDLPRHAIPV